MAKKTKPVKSTGVTEAQVKAAALRACEMLGEAYENGEANGGDMDWNDVDSANDQATHALALEKRLKAQGVLLS